MKKILVTGGLGFIGCNLVNYLISKNYFIINIDKSSYSSNKKYFINSKNKVSLKYDSLSIEIIFFAPINQRDIGRIGVFPDPSS